MFATQTAAPREQVLNAGMTRFASRWDDMTGGAIRHFLQKAREEDHSLFCHSIRVALASGSMAKELGMDEWQTASVVAAALIHEIAEVIGVAGGRSEEPDAFDPMPSSAASLAARSTFSVLGLSVASDVMEILLFQKAASRLPLGVPPRNGDFILSGACIVSLADRMDDALHGHPGTRMSVSRLMQWRREECLVGTQAS